MSMQARIRSVRYEAEGILSFRLEPMPGAEFPPFTAGAHIDVTLGQRLVRSYSLLNDPAQRNVYEIAVQLDPGSRGGSRLIHAQWRAGQVIEISEPRNHFPLVEDARHSVLIAGGIGITPLLSMARFLDKSSLPYELHYFARNADNIAFASELSVLHGRIEQHLGLDVEAVRARISTLLGPWQFANHVYICGPGPMLELVRDTASDLGWPDEAIHFEYFQNTTEIDASSAFDVELARSAMTLHVPAGKTILEVMREAGLTVPSSCEQGACGTCLTTVIEGEVDHQDVYLNKTEKASNTCMMTCVSRAKGGRLVLDI